MSFLEKWFPSNQLGKVVDPPKVDSLPVQAVVLQKPEPPPPPIVKETLVKPFRILVIDHQVTLEEIRYDVHVRDFHWSGTSTHAQVTISRSGFWEVRSQFRLMLTYCGCQHDCTDEMIGAFANKGLMVNRRLVDACLFPIQSQILEIERRIRSFE